MKTSKIIMLVITLCFLGGCSVLNQEYASYDAMDNHESYGSGYGEDYADTAEQSSPKSSVDPEVPVQMTKKDGQLEALKPQSKKPAKPNSNVLLPISNGDL